MEKYAALLLDFVRLIATHLETVISVAAFIMSGISLTISLRDRKNFVKIELFKGRDYLLQNKIDFSKDPHKLSYFYVIVRNTGRTNIFVRTAWLSVNGFDFKLVDPKTITYGGTLGLPEVHGEDPDRPLEPYTERLYRIHYDAIHRNSELANTEELHIKAFIRLQSGKKADSGKELKVRSSEIFGDL